MEREQLRHESTLVVTVQSDEFHDDIQSAITSLERDERTDAPSTISFTSYDELMGTLTPKRWISSRQSAVRNRRVLTRRHASSTERSRTSTRNSVGSHNSSSSPLRRSAM
jgi:hypothetical protein